MTALLAFGLVAISFASLSQERLQQEREEIREGVETAIEPYIAVAEFDTVVNIRVLVTLYEFVQ
jgi:hypothetical protein